MGMGIRGLALAALLTSACQSHQDETRRAAPFDATSEPADREITTALAADLRAEITSTEAFFGAPFPNAFHFEVAPSRDAFSAVMRERFGVPETECWMVASGVSDLLLFLSPRVWKTEACEHDPDDAAHVKGLVAHELVHVYHGQRNPTRDFTGADEIGWFIEGLATYASGQLEREHAGKAREALQQGAGPERLADAWSGKYRYAVAGSIVRHIDRTSGRAMLNELLAKTRQDEILAALGTTEEELLAEWRAAVLAEPGR